MDKAALRRQLYARLHALSETDARAADTAIADAVIHTTDWEDIERISCYIAQPGFREVDTLRILNYLQTKQPHITIDVVEPHQAAIIPSVHYNLIIVPVLGYDDEFNRLGRGAGWYDRFLATQPQARAIGLAYSCQRVESIPVEEFDVPLDDVVTE